MPGLLADINAEGHLEALLRICQSDRWIDVWAALKVGLFNFQQVGSAKNTSDVELWKFCQRQELLLVTVNRNRRGTHSLQAAIEQFNKRDSLPALTLSNPKRLLRDRRFAERAPITLMEILVDLNERRGAGRLWLP